jgi:CxxC motif-containing protein (DUF1111 family)
MRRELTIVVAGLLGLQALPAASQNAAANQAASQQITEAPAGFDTPTLVRTPGLLSHSNGFAEPTDDSYALDQEIYETAHDVTTGLGPAFNARACVDCHANPVAGGSGQFTELRVGHLDANGNFVNPTIPINDGADTITGRSLVNDRALSPQVQEHIPDTETIRALRATLNTLGDGFVEAIADSTLLAIAAQQPKQSGGLIHGEAVPVPVLESPGQSRIGRFGWKDQHSSLLSFIGDAYLNEMGVTNRLRPHDTTTIDKQTPDPEDVPDAIGLADIDHFAVFVRGTKVPPRDTTLAATYASEAGANVFHTLQCDICHVSSIVTAPPGTVIINTGDAHGNPYAVPAALGNKRIHPYSDFLLHDVGTGDGIVQNPPADTANKLRTSALWGLRMKPRFMHDLQSLSLQDAIKRHAGEAAQASKGFQNLPETQQQQLITFLNSL